MIAPAHPCRKRISDKIDQFLEMRADGASIGEAAASIGTHYEAIRYWRRRWPERFGDAAKEQQAPPHIRAGIVEYIRLRAAGQSANTAAVAIGVHRSTIDQWWRKKWPELFAAEMNHQGIGRNDLMARSPLRHEVVAAMEAGDITTLPGFFERVYRPRRLLGASTNTFRLYTVTLTHFRRFLGRIPMIADLTEDGIAAFLQYLNQPHGKAGKDRSAYTLNKTRNGLMAMAKVAWMRKLLPDMPDVGSYPEPHRVPVAFTVDEVGRLLAECQRTPGMITGIPAGKWWFALLQLFYWTGLRSGTVWKLPQARVDLAAGTVLAEASTQKHKADQLLRIHPDCVAALREIWQPERELMFPWDHDPGSRYRDFRRILARAGLTCPPFCVFHKIRKTTATLCKRYGGDATAQLGHTSDAITREHYLATDAYIQAADCIPRPGINTDSTHGTSPDNLLAKLAAAGFDLAAVRKALANGNGHSGNVPAQEEGGAV